MAVCVVSTLQQQEAWEGMVKAPIFYTRYGRPGKQGKFCWCKVSEAGRAAPKDPREKTVSLGVRGFVCSKNQSLAARTCLPLAPPQKWR